MAAFWDPDPIAYHRWDRAWWGWALGLGAIFALVAFAYCSEPKGEWYRCNYKVSEKVARLVDSGEMSCFAVEIMMEE